MDIKSLRMKTVCGLVSESPSMTPVVEFLSQHSKTRGPIIIEGERGTGKEFAARFVHYTGRRAKAPFSTLSVTALPPELVSEELYQPGIGRLHQARGGSLLLKELWALPKRDQRRLAEILEDDDKRDKTPLEVYDVRLMMTSSMELEAAVRSNFVEPELKRVLSTRRIVMPPLRRRPSDIPELANLFMDQMIRDLDRPPLEVDPRVFELFVDYHWPGNIEELKDVVRQLVAKVPGRKLHEGHLTGLLPTVEEEISLERFSLEELVRAKLKSFFYRIRGFRVEGLYAEVMSRVERPLIELILAETNGNQLRAAKLLGINRNTLRKKIQKMKLRVR
jgi:two-component system, NtrC family, nitrogen regulation response regulator GlnG